MLQHRRSAVTAPSTWVWHSEKSETGHVVNPEKPWRHFLKAAGIAERCSLHDVRRTLGSSLASSGISLPIISKALGHVSAQSARAYVHLDVEPARNAMSRPWERSGMPRKPPNRFFTRVEQHSNPDPQAAPLRALIGATLIDFDEFATLDPKVSGQLVDDLEEAVRRARRL